jgi:hypothetical protein
MVEGHVGIIPSAGSTPVPGTIYLGYLGSLVLAGRFGCLACAAAPLPNAHRTDPPEPKGFVRFNGGGVWVFDCGALGVEGGGLLGCWVVAVFLNPCWVGYWGFVIFGAALICAANGRLYSNWDSFGSIACQS